MGGPLPAAVAATRGQLAPQASEVVEKGCMVFCPIPLWTASGVAQKTLLLRPLAGEGTIISACDLLATLADGHARSIGQP